MNYFFIIGLTIIFAVSWHRRLMAQMHLAYKSALLKAEDDLIETLNIKTRSPYSLILAQAVYKLKASKDPLSASLNVEVFDADKYFDIELRVRLKKKKSQLDIGLEMFEAR